MGVVITIDGDKKPFVPPFLKLEDHRLMGEFEWDPSRIDLWSDVEHIGDIKTVLEKVNEKPIANVNLLDFLIDHQELIPKEWEKLSLFFLGTTYFTSCGDVHVRCLRKTNFWAYETLWYRNLWHTYYRVVLIAPERV